MVRVRMPGRRPPPSKLAKYQHRPISEQEIRAAETELATRHLYDFVKQAWSQVESTPFVDNWHIVAICEHLQAVTAGQIPRLLMNIPPGCMKSWLTSVFWPAWEWTRDASVRWLHASYAQRLSHRDAVRCRTLIDGPWYRGNWGHRFGFKEDQNQKGYYETTAGGFRLSTTIGGYGTGEHPDRIVVDDPHNAKQAESDLEREQVIDWWTLTMSTRGVSRNARRVIIMQRLNERDLSGYVLEHESGLGWEHICLPMRHEHGRQRVTSLGWTDPRKESGELLFPGLFPEEKVKEQESPLGAYGIAGQMQQRPAPAEGSIFKNEQFLRFSVARLDEHAMALPDVRSKFSYGKEPKERVREIFELTTRDGRKKHWFAWQCWWFQTIDTAMKDGRDNDYTSAATFAVTPDWEILVYDVWRAKVTVPDQYPMILRLRDRFPQVEFQAVEDRSSGTGLIQQSVRDGRPFVALKADSSKTMRARVIATYYGAGSVYHRVDMPTLTDFEDELLTFPTGVHDDMVDVLSYGGIVVLDRASKQPCIRVLDILGEQQKQQQSQSQTPGQAYLEKLFVRE